MSARGGFAPRSGFAARTGGQCGESPLTTAIHSKYKTAGGRASSSRPIYLGQTCVGVVQPGGIFEKRVRSSHVLRVPKAIALQRSVLDHVRSLGVSIVRALMVDEDRVLEAELADFTTHGFSVERGFGSQVGLELCHWRDPDGVQGVLSL